MRLRDFIGSQFPFRWFQIRRCTRSALGLLRLLVASFPLLPTSFFKPEHSFWNQATPGNEITTLFIYAWVSVLTGSSDALFVLLARDRTTISKFSYCSQAFSKASLEDQLTCYTCSCKDLLLRLVREHLTMHGCFLFCSLRGQSTMVLCWMHVCFFCSALFEAERRWVFVGCMVAFSVLLSLRPKDHEVLLDARLFFLFRYGCFFRSVLFEAKRPWCFVGCTAAFSGLIRPRERSSTENSPFGQEEIFLNLKSRVLKLLFMFKEGKDHLLKIHCLILKILFQLKAVRGPGTFFGIKRRKKPPSDDSRLGDEDSKLEFTTRHRRRKARVHRLASNTQSSSSPLGIEHAKLEFTARHRTRKARIYRSASNTQSLSSPLGVEHVKIQFTAWRRTRKA